MSFTRVKRKKERNLNNMVFEEVNQQNNIIYLKIDINGRIYISYNNSCEWATEIN